MEKNCTLCGKRKKIDKTNVREENTPQSLIEDTINSLINGITRRYEGIFGDYHIMMKKSNAPLYANINSEQFIFGKVIIIQQVAHVNWLVSGANENIPKLSFRSILRQLERACFSQGYALSIECINSSNKIIHSYQKLGYVITGDEFSNSIIKGPPTSNRSITHLTVYENSFYSSYSRTQGQIHFVREFNNERIRNLLYSMLDNDVEPKDMYRSFLMSQLRDIIISGPFNILDFLNDLDFINSLPPTMKSMYVEYLVNHSNA